MTSYYHSLPESQLDRNWDLQKNHVGSGKVLALAMTNAWAVLSVVNSIAISLLILHVIVICKNLTAAIQVHMSIG